MSLDSDLFIERITYTDIFEKVSRLRNYVSSIPAVTYATKLATGLTTLVFGELPQPTKSSVGSIYRGHPDYIGPRLPYSLEMLHEVKNMEPCCVTRPAKLMPTASKQYTKLAPVIPFDKSVKPAA